MTVWKTQNMQTVLENNFRATFEPDGENIIICYLSEGRSFFIDRKIEIWNSGFSFNTEKRRKPLILLGKLQKKFRKGYIC